MDKPTSVTAAIPVEYDSGPSGEVVLPEEAVEGLGRTRRPVMWSAVVLFIGAGLGMMFCGAAIFGAIMNLRSGNAGDAKFLSIIATAFFIFTCAPLIGGFMLLRLLGAMRRAYRLRRAQDWERVILAQLWVWRLFPIALGVAMIVPFVTFITMTVASGNFP